MCFAIFELTYCKSAAGETILTIGQSVFAEMTKAKNYDKNLVTFLAHGILCRIIAQTCTKEFST